jgi:hypothetical protein
LITRFTTRNENRKAQYINFRGVTPDGRRLSDNEISEILTHKEHVFAPGAVVDWGARVRLATGHPLDPSHFVRQFVAAGWD